MCAWTSLCRPVMGATWRRRYRTKYRRSVSCSSTDVNPPNPLPPPLPPNPTQILLKRLPPVPPKLPFLLPHLSDLARCCFVEVDFDNAASASPPPLPSPRAPASATAVAAGPGLAGLELARRGVRATIENKKAANAVGRRRRRWEETLCGPVIFLAWNTPPPPPPPRTAAADPKAIRLRLVAGDRGSSMMPMLMLAKEMVVVVARRLVS